MSNDNALSLFEITEDLSKESLLWRKVVIQAYMDIAMNVKTPQDEQIKLEAITWFFSGGHELDDVCDMAKLDVKSVVRLAQKLLEMN